MRFLVRFSNQGHTPAEARTLSLEAFDVVKQFGGDVGNLRVSSYAIELDVLLESKSNLQDTVQGLEASLGRLLTLRELDTPVTQLDVNEEIRNGVELFNSERYWESHEALEYAWRKASGSEKEVLQGVILVAAALVHLQKDEREVALSVMQRALEKLSGKESVYFEMDIEDLRNELSRMLSASIPMVVKIKMRG